MVSEALAAGMQALQAAEAEASTASAQVEKVQKQWDEENVELAHMRASAAMTSRVTIVHSFSCQSGSQENDIGTIVVTLAVLFVASVYNHPRQCRLVSSFCGCCCCSLCRARC